VNPAPSFISGTASTLTRGEMTLVIKAVPAQGCANCGEEYVNEDTTAILLRSAEDAAKAGVQVDVRQFVPV
jgi:YgiT-type zinc finger domain-containing protein